MPVKSSCRRSTWTWRRARLSAGIAAEGEADAGCALFDIETRQGRWRVEEPASGGLHHIVAAPGQTVDVGSPVVRIHAEGEAVPAASVAGCGCRARPAPEVPSPAPACLRRCPCRGRGARQPVTEAGSARPDRPRASCASGRRAFGAIVWHRRRAADPARGCRASDHGSAPGAGRAALRAPAGRRPGRRGTTRRRAISVSTQQGRRHRW